MAERRMFAKTIIDSDAFIEMPLSAQALYFHLGMRADDDGFLNNARKIQGMIRASDDDLKILIAKRFLIVFDGGIVVIKHWLINNLIRNDRYKETIYTEEKAFLVIKDNGVYTESVIGIPDGNQSPTRLTQDRLGKDSIGKVSINKIYGKLENVKLSEDEYSKLIAEYGPDTINDYIDRLSIWMPNAPRKVKSCYATLLNWLRRDKIPVKPRLLTCPDCGATLSDGICPNPECPSYRR